MSDLPRFVSGVVDVINVFGLIQFSLPKSHPFYEVWVYEVVGGSQVHQHFYIGHVVACSNGYWNSHRTKAHHVYRVTM
jgi:hypothetical protein